MLVALSWFLPEIKRCVCKSLVKENLMGVKDGWRKAMEVELEVAQFCRLPSVMSSWGLRRDSKAGIPLEGSNTM
jgi:hypothetical protein